MVTDILDWLWSRMSLLIRIGNPVRKTTHVNKKKRYKRIINHKKIKARRLVIMESGERRIGTSRNAFYIFSDYPLYKLDQQNQGLHVYIIHGEKGVMFNEHPPEPYSSDIDVIRRFRYLLYEKSLPSHNYKVVFSTLGHNLFEINDRLDFEMRSIQTK